MTVTACRYNMYDTASLTREHVQKGNSSMAVTLPLKPPMTSNRSGTPPTSSAPPLPIERAINVKNLQKNQESCDVSIHFKAADARLMTQAHCTAHNA
eukprot:9110-Heterococcus_DN1.PRE.3